MTSLIDTVRCRKLRIRPWIWIAWFLAMLPQSFAAPTGFNSDIASENGLALALELRSQKPSKNLATGGVLKLRNAAGQRTEIPIKFELVLETNGWRTLYETMPTNGSSECLMVRHVEQAATQYYLATKTNQNSSTVRSEPLSDPSLWQPFAGSDFSLVDLGLEFFHWPQQRIAKSEMRRGRRFSVLESRHGREVGAYARVLSWIDPATGGLLRAEAYDDSGQLVKEFSVRSVKRGQLKEIQIRNLKTHSITRLEFDLEIEPLLQEDE